MIGLGTMFNICIRLGLVGRTSGHRLRGAIVVILNRCCGGTI